MLNVTYGRPDRPQLREIIEQLERCGISGEVYLGYPVITLADDPVSVDVLVLTDDQRMLALSVPDAMPVSDGDWEKIANSEEEIYFVLHNIMNRSKALRSGRDLRVEVNVASVFPTEIAPPDTLNQIEPVALGDLASYIAELPTYPSECDAALRAAIQHVRTAKPTKKRAGVTQVGSRGAVIQQIESEIANLDRWQQKAAIECPDAPQRIRGLAGSGKTVALALKAAYLHAQHPDWTIGVTFYTRSLYQQFRELIRRFSMEQLADEPDWERLRVLHAWGSAREPGVYSVMAGAAGAVPRDFLYARTTYGTGKAALGGICGELLQSLGRRGIPIFDALLVDEAQDMPTEFFRLALASTTDEHRLVWAYDEMQNLTEDSMPSVEELFGLDDGGLPVVSLSKPQHGPQQDIILRVCYRNTPWALVTAHALGLGVYREGGLIQHFDELRAWSEAGYEVAGGQLAPGQEVVLRRMSSSHPAYFENLIRPDDAVRTEVFASSREQVQWIGEQVARNVTDEELDPDDILIVLPDVRMAKRDAAPIMEALARHGISSHLVGATQSQDEIRVGDSVALAHIHRAKGNEAPMVYVADCERCNTGIGLIAERNTLFTAITRSRAWVRLCGIGAGMTEIADEISRLQDENYMLRFHVPTEDELTTMKRIHRERTADEQARIQSWQEGIAQFIAAVQRGELSLDNLPIALRQQLEGLLRQGDST